MSWGRGVDGIAAAMGIFVVERVVLWSQGIENGDGKAVVEIGVCVDVRVRLRRQWMVSPADVVVVVSRIVTL